MKKSRGKTIAYLLRIALTALCAFVLAFILSNSLQTGAESAKQSNEVVETVQKVVAAVAPESPIATATGEAYDQLHELVRTAAHFSEFALFGTLMVWCCFYYTMKRRWQSLPIGMVALTAILDEFLQTFSSGRGAELKDVLVDVVGGWAGCLFALLTVLIGGWIVRKRRARLRKNLCNENGK